MIAIPALLNACVIICLCALVCELASFCVPGWLIVVFDGPFMKLRRNYAVWYLYECVTNVEHVLFTETKCTSESYEVKLTERRQELLEDSEWDLAFTSSEVVRWEIEVTFGVLSLLIASLLLFRLRRCNMKAICQTGNQEPSDAAFWVPAIFTVASGILFTFPVVQMTQANITRAQSVAKEEVPYGAVLAASGAFMSLCCSAIFMCMFFKRRNRSDVSVINRVDGSVQELPMQA